VAAMEEILIRTRLIDFSDTSLVMEGLMLDKEARNLKALIWFDFVYISLTNGRTAKHPDDLMQRFESVVVIKDYDPDGFKRRVEGVKLEVRKSSRNDE
jgi:acyl-CoA thioester hydrolase